MLYDFFAALDDISHLSGGVQIVLLLLAIWLVVSLVSIFVDIFKR